MPRLPKGRERVMFFEQHFFRDEAGGGPCQVLAKWQDDQHSRDGFLQPGQYPPFSGRAAWFRVREHKKGVYTFLEQVAGKDGEPFIAPW